MGYKVDPSEAYCQALGEFIVHYADAEACMFEVLKEASGVTRAVAKALYSGTRPNQAMSWVRRITEAQGIPLDPHLARAFPKFSELTTERDKILHHGHQTLKGEVLVTTSNRNIERAAIRKIVKAHDIKLMTYDVNVVRACLMAYIIKKRYKRLRKYDPWLKYADLPWRYTASQPAGKQGKK